jgi:hypothetical protein
MADNTRQVEMPLPDGKGAIISWVDPETKTAGIWLKLNTGDIAELAAVSLNKELEPNIYRPYCLREPDEKDEEFNCLEVGIYSDPYAEDMTFSDITSIDKYYDAYGTDKKE